MSLVLESRQFYAFLVFNGYFLCFYDFINGFSVSAGVWWVRDQMPLRESKFWQEFVNLLFWCFNGFYGFAFLWFPRVFMGRVWLVRGRQEMCLVPESRSFPGFPGLGGFPAKQELGVGDTFVPSHHW